MKYWNMFASIFSDPALSSGVWVASLIFIVYMHKMYQRQLNDRQKEIDRLAEQNSEYRKFFSQLIKTSLKAQLNPNQHDEKQK